ATCSPGRGQALEMRVLFVAMAHSVHTARWIAQLRGRGWDLHLFPVESARLHPELHDVTLPDAWGCDRSARPPSARGRRAAARGELCACECQRDVALPRAHGLRGEVLPVLPNAGGSDLDGLRALRSDGPASGRRLVLLKGYQGWAGRALVGLRGLERAAECLKGYRVVVYSADADVALAARLASQDTGVPIDIASERPHVEMLALHGRARVSIGLSLGDGISTSLLEAMVMGSFPVQSTSKIG